MEKKNQDGRRVFIRIDDEDEIEQAVDQMLDELLGEQEDEDQPSTKAGES